MIKPAPVLLALLALACDGPSERRSEPPAPEPASEVASETPPDAAKPAFELTLPEIPETPAASTPEQVRELHKRYRAQLGDTRALRDEGKLADAILGYHALLELDPTDATVLHEFADVAERLGQHPLAEAALTRALRYARDKDVQFRLHADLGRVLEFMGEGRAMDHYREALALHEDSALRERFLLSGEGFTSLDDVCNYLIRDLARCKPDDPCDALEDFECEEPVEDEGGALALTHDEGYHYIYPVVRTPLGWSVFGQFAEVINPGVNGMSGEYSSSESIHSHAGVDYLVIEYEYENSDADNGTGEYTTDGQAGVVVCRVDGLQARCTTPYVYRSYGCWESFETGATEGDCADNDTYKLKGGDIVIRDGKKTITHSFEADLRPTTPPAASAP
jgi:tetratricopeptide (TPR) repeat protein